MTIKQFWMTCRGNVEGRKENQNNHINAHSNYGSDNDVGDDDENGDEDDDDDGPVSSGNSCPNSHSYG